MNRIAPTATASADCPVVTDAGEIAERFQEMLGDESRLRAESVESIFLPETPEQAAAALGQLSAAGKCCVVSGARTGIAGAAVPIDVDAVVSTAKMSRLLALGKDGDEWYARCEPGLTLADLGEALTKKNVNDLPGATSEEAAAAGEYASSEFTLWLPVDPTEMTASVGGVISTNASGARTYRYGPMRDWVRAVTVALADGRLLRVRRGECVADGHSFLFVNSDGNECEIKLPDISIPTGKATLGYHVAPGMDLVDLLVGSEGTLGMVVEAEVKLTARPASVIGVLAVVEDEEKALILVEMARASTEIAFDSVEYFDHDSLTMLQAKKVSDGPGSHIPDIPNWDGAAVYLEFSGSEEETEAACMPLEELLGEVGSSLDDTWAAMEPAELEEQKLFRHTVPEAVNTFIGQQATKVPGLHKVGTDMAVPDDKLRDVFALYRKGLSETGLDSVVFGHIGNNHVHVNILPKNLDELAKAKGLYLEWAKGVVAMGGAVAAEHGIGRIKKSMLEVQYDADTLASMRAVRQAFDPKGTLAPGVLL